MKKMRTAAFFLALGLILASCKSADYSTYQFSTESSAAETAEITVPEPTGETAEVTAENTADTETQEGKNATATETSPTETEESVTETVTDKETEKETEEEKGESGDEGSIFDHTGNDDSSDDDGGFVVNDGANTAYQLTEADIQKMNNGKAVIIRSNDGYVSTVIGKYYDKKIKVIPGDISTFEEAILSLNGMATLLGFKAGTEFFADNGSRDKAGYTYLTYRQKYAGAIVENATLHIVLDPDEVPCAVSCSFTPEIGISEGGGKITAEEALKAAQEVVESSGYSGIKFYPDSTAEAAVPFQARVFKCWVVVSDNPEEQDSFEYMHYMKYYISAEDGSFLFAMPSSTLTLNLEQDNYPTDEIFKGLEKTEYTATIDFLGIGKQKVTIPTAYNPNDGKYYMIDIDRKIAIADYSAFMDNYAFEVEFYSSDDNTWDDRDVAALYNYEAAYDAYDSIGVPSPDGFESMYYKNDNA